MEQMGLFFFWKNNLFDFEILIVSFLRWAFIYLFFNWRIIALQSYVSFFCTAMYVYIYPLPLEHPSYHPHLTLAF